MSSNPGRSGGTKYASLRQRSASARAPRVISALLQPQNRGGAGHFAEKLSGRRYQDGRGTTLAASAKVQRQPPEVTGLVHEPRRGVYYASELLHHREARAYSREFRALERVCLIRFPPDVAALLRQRLAAHQAGLDCSFSSEDVPMGPLGTSELGLTITPTPGDDYRLFDVALEKRLGNPASTVRLAGILVELPCLIEAYKSLEGELLFKSNDISQMLYVYDPDAPGGSPDLSQIRDTQLWEWHGGITPGTHRIRHRRFKNFNVFDKPDVAAAERELCTILNQRHARETSTLEGSTEYVMEEHLEAMRRGELERTVTAVIGPENPILYAAAHQVPPSAAVAPFDASNQTAADLLRRYSELQASAFVSLEDRLRFSVNPDIRVSDTGGIPDDLSEKLFGELGDGDQLQEDLQLEDDVQDLSFSLRDAGAVASSSDASLSSDDARLSRKERRNQIKREKLKSK